MYLMIDRLCQQKPHMIAQYCHLQENHELWRLAEGGTLPKKKKTTGGPDVYYRHSVHFVKKTETT